MTWIIVVFPVLLFWYLLHRCQISAGWCPFCEFRNWIAKQLMAYGMRKLKQCGFTMEDALKHAKEKQL